MSKIWGNRKRIGKFMIIDLQSLIKKQIHFKSMYVRKIIWFAYISSSKLKNAISTSKSNLKNQIPYLIQNCAVSMTITVITTE